MRLTEFLHDLRASLDLSLGGLFLSSPQPQESTAHRLWLIIEAEGQSPAVVAGIVGLAILLVLNLAQIFARYRISTSYRPASKGAPPQQGEVTDPDHAAASPAFQHPSRQPDHPKIASTESPAGLQSPAAVDLPPAAVDLPPAPPPLRCSSLPAPQAPSQITSTQMIPRMTLATAATLDSWREPDACVTTGATPDLEVTEAAVCADSAITCLEPADSPAAATSHQGPDAGWQEPRPQAAASLSGPAAVTSAAAPAPEPGACSSPKAAFSGTPGQHLASYQDTSRRCYVLPVAVAPAAPGVDAPGASLSTDGAPSHTVRLRLFFDLESVVNPSNMHVEVLAAQHQGALLYRAVVTQAEIQAGCSSLHIPAASLDPSLALLHVLLFKCPGAADPAHHQPEDLVDGGFTPASPGRDYTEGRCNEALCHAPGRHNPSSSHIHHPGIASSSISGARASAPEPPPEPATLLAALPVLCLPEAAAAEVDGQFEVMVRAYLAPGATLEESLGLGIGCTAHPLPAHPTPGPSQDHAWLVPREPSRRSRLSWEDEPVPSKSYTATPGSPSLVLQHNRFLSMLPGLARELLEEPPLPALPAGLPGWSAEDAAPERRGLDAGDMHGDGSPAARRMSSQSEILPHPRQARDDSLPAITQRSNSLPQTLPSASPQPAQQPRQAAPRAAASHIFPLSPLSRTESDWQRMLEQVLPSCPMHVLSPFSAPDPEVVGLMGSGTSQAAPAHGTGGGGDATDAAGSHFSATHSKVFHDYSSKLAMHLDVLRAAALGPAAAQDPPTEGTGREGLPGAECSGGRKEGGGDPDAGGPCGDGEQEPGCQGASGRARDCRMQLDLDVMTAQVCGVAQPDDLPSFTTGPLPHAPSPLYWNSMDPGVEQLQKPALEALEAGGSLEGAGGDGPLVAPGEGSAVDPAAGGVLSSIGPGGEQQLEAQVVQRSSDVLTDAFLTSHQSVVSELTSRAADLVPGLLWFMLHQRLTHCFRLAAEWLEESQALALVHHSTPVSPTTAATFVEEQLAMNERPPLVLKKASTRLGSVGRFKEYWPVLGGQPEEALGWEEHEPARTQHAADTSNARELQLQGSRRAMPARRMSAQRMNMSDAWVLSCQLLFKLVMTVTAVTLVTASDCGAAADSRGLHNVVLYLTTRCMLRFTLMLGLLLREAPILLLLLLRPCTYAACRLHILKLMLGFDTLQLASLLSHAVAEMCVASFSRDCMLLLLLLLLDVQARMVPFVLTVSSQVCIRLLVLEAVPSIVLLMLALATAA